ncbi:hypothetical protein, partial [Maribacter sp.]|uniref:hypothetical protein n=1 Tax=Maribacter sp. TaxID=1897614 RepID=UPI0025C05AEE
MKIALIELTKSHEECIYSQIKFLKEDSNKIHLIIHPNLENQTKAYHNMVSKIRIFNFDSSVFFIKRIIKLFKLYSYLKNQNFDTIIYNSASSKKEIIALNFLLPQKKIKSFGTIHNLKKINNSFSQKLISKNLKKYFVINDHLLSPSFNNLNIKLHSYYPIFFPNFSPIEIVKEKDSTWICIPGELDYNRRDYDLILNAASALNNKKILFIILGKVNKSNPKVQDFFKTLSNKKIENNFLLFDSFIDNNTFHAYLKKSDYICT